MNSNRYFDYSRRSTFTVNIGGIPLGSDHPLRIQTMTNTATDDIEASTAQCLRCAAAGADYVRLTAQGVKQAQSIGSIHEALREQDCRVPLIADIHFNPNAALAAAAVCEKVRINPGNFVDPARTFKQLSYTDEEYAAEVERIREALLPLIAICREHHTALRIGVNHGSLSDRIMSRYGNTAPGMVESAMEFLRILHSEHFDDVVVSMKASNVVVMVEAVRRMAAAMDAEGMRYPLHLGVTEAGFGEDGRIKSAVGIGTLLSEGLGDTLRVSLSEEPELEIPVAQKLAQYISRRAGHAHIEGTLWEEQDRFAPTRRITTLTDGRIGGGQAPIVVGSMAPDALTGMHPDYFINQSDLEWVHVDNNTPAAELQALTGRDRTVIVVEAVGENVPGSQLAVLHRLAQLGVDCPTIIHNVVDDDDLEWLQVKAGADMGAVMLSGLADGVWLEAPNIAQQQQVIDTALAVLQATRQRISKTEFISCPGCGRTMFDLQTTVKRVKAATAHLTHLKIGVMGCVVNGPGEMADADYGYVGAARNRISLYKGKTCIEKNIPEDEAIDRLLALIHQYGDDVRH